MDNRELFREEFVTIGRILKEWGLIGEFLALPLTFDPERFLKLSEIGIQFKDFGETIEWKKLRSVKFHKNLLLLRIDGCDSPEEARRYRHALLKIKKSESPELPEGVYYHYQIIGLKVYTVDGIYLGQIKSILETGSNDVYIVRESEREYLIPAIKEVVKEIDLKANRMIVKPLEI
jgi:16S rRNA processing protein RimM